MHRYITYTLSLSYNTCTHKKSRQVTLPDSLHYRVMVTRVDHRYRSKDFW